MHLREFVVAVQPMRVCDLTSSVVHDWIKKRYGKLSDSQRHNAARCVCRVINWAIDENLIDRSPLKRFRKPAPGRRESFITPTQYATVLRTLKGRPASQSRKDVVMFLWHTGCRPQELRIIEAKWIEGSKIVLPRELSKGKQKRRVIYLDGTTKRIVTRLSRQFPTGPIFRSYGGKPWTKNSLGLAFRRLKKHTAIPHLCLYAFRHGFVTRMLEKGVDVVTVAKLCGNSPLMITTVYEHVAENEARLLDVLSASTIPARNRGAALSNNPAAKSGPSESTSSHSPVMEWRLKLS
jgi:integrase